MKIPYFMCMFVIHFSIRSSPVMAPGMCKYCHTFQTHYLCCIKCVGYRGIQAKTCLLEKYKLWLMKLTRLRWCQHACISDAHYRKYITYHSGTDRTVIKYHVLAINENNNKIATDNNTKQEHHPENSSDNLNYVWQEHHHEISSDNLNYVWGQLTGTCII